jgi:hypothetical protein
VVHSAEAGYPAFVLTPPYEPELKISSKQTALPEKIYLPNPAYKNKNTVCRAIENLTVELLPKQGQILELPARSHQLLISRLIFLKFLFLHSTKLQQGKPIVK